MPVLCSLHTRALFPLVVVLLTSACGGSAAAGKGMSSATEASDRPVLEPYKIVFAMRGHERDFRVCFMKSPNQRGMARVVFEVDAEGVVTRSDLDESTIGKNEVDSCLLQQTEALRFGSLRQPVRGSWTFVFRLAEPLSDKERAELLSKAEEEDADENAEQDEPSVVVESSSPGRLDVHQIEETIEVGFPLFARCYRDALNRRDRKGGSAKFRLAIDSEGRVESLSDAGSKMSDALAVDCIAEGFYAMNFPAPRGGPVSATYRLELD